MREPMPSLVKTLTGGEQLARGTAGEGFRAHRHEHLVRGAQLLASIEPPVLASQPLAGRMG
jgi:hypothetical protein